MSNTLPSVSHEHHLSQLPELTREHEIVMNCIPLAAELAKLNAWQLQDAWMRYNAYQKAGIAFDYARQWDGHAYPRELDKRRAFA